MHCSALTIPLCIAQVSSEDVAALLRIMCGQQQVFQSDMLHKILRNLVCYRLPRQELIRTLLLLMSPEAYSDPKVLAISSELPLCSA